ncbi:MAG TPA: oligosaccharide flippase family protein [Chloroflexota bacterium]|nr:oligosaccharide flippase family protein [Chloroflexota bacterium]
MITLRSRMRTLSSQSLVYGLSGALTKVVGLIIVPILLHIFTPADYAVIDLVTGFTSIIGAILILGSDSAVAFYFYRQKDEESKRALISTWLYFQFALNTLAGLCLFLLSGPLGQVVLGPDPHDKIYFQLVAAVFPLSSSFGYGLEILRLQLRPRRYLLVSAVNILTGFILTLVVVVAMHGGLTGVYVSSALTNVVAFIAAMWAVRGRLSRRFSPRMLRAILAYGVPLVPISAASWAIGQSSRFFIKAHTGLPDAGLFSAGSKVAQLMLLAVTAFSLAWGPFAFSISEEPDARRTYARVLTYYVAVMGWFALVLSLFAPLILEVGRPAYARAYQVVPFLTMSYLITGAYYIVAVGTSLSKKTIHLTWPTVAGGAVTVAVNVFVVPLPYFSLVGGALAILCGNAILVWLVYWVSQRLYPIPFELKRVFPSVAILAMLVILGQVSHGFVKATSPSGLLIEAALMVAYPVLLLSCGVIQPYEVGIVTRALRVRARRK